MKVKSESEVLNHVRLFATPWIAAYQAPPSMGFSRQEYWSGVLLPSLPLIIREIQRICAMNYHFIPVGMTSIKKISKTQKATSVGEDVENWNPVHYR